jgi:hypothetical protein
MAVATDTEVVTMTKCLVNGELREAPGSCVTPSPLHAFQLYARRAEPSRTPRGGRPWHRALG